ncbi:4-hydroxy-tetrahydrodipicolinate synthase [Sporomusa sp.]|uniref:4-hydroxy-tetrahydrodipicolinate synthase n=1 Tax=Sporomusa sp. TaxID=2078658 RepID=UPI002CAD2024|nr:4-hydroxy-tetrahydrodipicolinate synthase [Sporomusa sp.]HWR45414.1 4-hydroxy-tetrahydrodipicolinate synthase [Sporomusa sp.]
MFKGILSPVITILDKNGKLDFNGNKILINRLIDNGINGLLFLGSIGEFFALSKEEKQEFIRFVVRVVNKRVPVLIGTGGTVLDEVIELTRFAVQEGADAVVVISPYYFKLDSETIYRYYASLAQSTSLPIMLYNFPDRTAVDLAPELVLRLAKEFKHIVAIKDTVDNISHTRKLIQVVKAERPDFCVLSGFDEYLIPNLMAGGDGILGGLTNVIPHVFVDLMKAYTEKDLEKVAAAQGQISILMNLYEVSQPFVAAIKGAVAQMGVPITPGVKAPAAALTSQQMQVIQKLLIKANVLETL